MGELETGFLPKLDDPRRGRRSQDAERLSPADSSIDSGTGNTPTRGERSKIFLPKKAFRNVTMAALVGSDMFALLSVGRSQHDATTNNRLAMNVYRT
jgi:hypothetical protein